MQLFLQATFLQDLGAMNLTSSEDEFLVNQVFVMAKVTGNGVDFAKHMQIQFETPLTGETHWSD